MGYRRRHRPAACAYCDLPCPKYTGEGVVSRGTKSPTLMTSSLFSLTSRPIPAHRRHVGRTSSHLTLRPRQVRHPRLERVYFFFLSPSDVGCERTREAWVMTSARRTRSGRDDAAAAAAVAAAAVDAGPAVCAVDAEPVAMGGSGDDDDDEGPGINDGPAPFASRPAPGATPFALGRPMPIADARAASSSGPRREKSKSSLIAELG